MVLKNRVFLGYRCNKSQEKDTTQKSPGYPTAKRIVLLYPTCEEREREFKAPTVLKTVTLKEKKFEVISN